ncbi:hypothetical protein AAC387_Pa02g1636 [Persea americana]
MISTYQCEVFCLRLLNLRKHMEGYARGNVHFDVAPVACLRIRWYRKEEGEDGSHTESNDSFKHELLEVPSRARSQSHLEALTHTPEEGDSSSRPEAGSHPSPPLNVEPQVEVTTGNTIAGKHVRGPSRGKEVQGIVDRYGKLNVPIPPEFRAPVGDYASKLASKIGVEVRTRLPDPSVRRWKYVDASVKGAIVQRLNNQFDLEGDPIDIEKAMNTKFGRRLSNHTYKLHKQFRELKDAKGEEYARNHPPKDVGPTKWIDLIDKKWNTTKFLRKDEDKT